MVSSTYNYLYETAEILSINPLYPPSMGDILKLGVSPRPPTGSILHLFFSGLHIFSFRYSICPECSNSMPAIRICQVVLLLL